MVEVDFSIIIPHKNLPSLLQRCLNSIPVRDDLEVIIVDDNSNPTIVDFKNFPGLNRKGVKVFFSKIGNGAGAARNIGIDLAKGKWLLFADCDDTYTLELNDFLDKYKVSEDDIIYYKCNIISDGSKRIVKPKMNIFIDNYLKNRSSLDDVKFGAWEPWNKLIRRSVVIKNNIRFDEISSSNDKMFSLYLGCYVKNISVSEKILYNYILRPGSTIHLGKKRFQNSFNTILRQNELYHKIKYRRKVFIPFFLLRNYSSVNYSYLSRYWEYLIRNKANPFEGFITDFLNDIRWRIFK